jgi:hypothetical protein
MVASMCGEQGALMCGGACGCSGESKLGAVEEATAEAAKYGDRSSEALAALVAEAKGMIEQARTEQAERARAAAEEAAAAAAVKALAEEAAAAKRQQLEQEMEALDARRRQVQAELGSGTPQTGAEETMCVVCFDAPKDHIMVPCGHQCVCGACAELMTKARTPTCPVCREPIRETMKVFCS